MPNITAGSEAFLTYATLRSATVPLFVLIWMVLCVMFPYTWRGALNRQMFVGVSHTYKCPSFIMAVFFLVVGLPMHLVGSWSLVDGVPGSAAATFVTTFKTSAILFIAVHAIMVLIRFKYTLAKWQALIVCEISKNMYLVFLLWGLSYAEEQMQIEHMMFTIYGFTAIMLAISFTRLFYAIRCEFDGDKFNHLYFGTDSNCPMQRFYLMCWVWEKNPMNKDMAKLDDVAVGDTK